MADMLAQDFVVKFNELNPENQKYVIAIQQALMFAQLSNKKIVLHDQTPEGVNTP